MKKQKNIRENMTVSTKENKKKQHIEIKGNDQFQTLMKS